MLVTGPTVSKTFPAGHGVLQLYGVGDLVELPDLKLSWEEPEKQTPYSVELWFKPAVPRNQIILYALAEKVGDELPFVFRATGTGAVKVGHAKDRLLEVDGALQVGVWQHLAFVFGGLETGYLYVNGKRKGSRQDMPKSAPWGHGARLSCPKDKPPMNEPTMGQIAMLRIWRIDRLELEIREFMYQNVIGPDRRWLVAEWPLNEGFGEFVFDRSRRLGRSRKRNLYEEPSAGKLVEGVEGEIKRKPEWVASAVPRRPMPSAADTLKPKAVYSLAPLVNEKAREESVGMFLTEFSDHPRKDQPRDLFSLYGLSFTVELWVKEYGTLDANASYILLTHWPWNWPGNTPNNEVLRIGIAADKFFMAFHDTPSTAEYKPDGQWHHWACVYHHHENDPQQRIRRIFKDGDNVGGNTGVDGYRVKEEKAFLLWTAGTIRSKAGPPPEHYRAAPCMLSEIRVWKEARSPEQIEANRLRRLDGTEPNLLLYCPLDRQDELADKTKVVRARVRYPADADVKPPELRRFPAEGFEKRRLSWLDDGPSIPPRSIL